MRERGWDGMSIDDVLAIPRLVIGTPQQMADELYAVTSASASRTWSSRIAAWLKSARTVSERLSGA